MSLIVFPHQFYFGGRHDGNEKMIFAVQLFLKLRQPVDGKGYFSPDFLFYGKQFRISDTRSLCREVGVNDKAALWRGRISAWKASGQSLRSFALQNGWRPRQLGYWKKRLEKVAGSTTSLIPAEIEHAVAAPAPITLCSPSGFTLQLASDTPAAWLAELLRSL